MAFSPPVRPAPGGVIATAGSLQKSSHQFVTSVERQLTAGGYGFIIGRLPGRRNPTSSKGERHGAVSMGARSQRRAVVGRNQDAVRTELRQGFEQRANDMAVDFLERLHLGIGPAFVRGFI